VLVVCCREAIGTNHSGKGSGLDSASPQERLKENCGKKVGVSLERPGAEVAYSPIVSGTPPVKKVPSHSSAGMARRLKHDLVLLGAFLIAGVVLVYQLVVTLLQPSWIGPVTDWLRAALAWPELFVVLFVSFWLTRTQRAGARAWWMFSLALLSYAFARTLWSVEDQFVFNGYVPFPWWSDLFFVLQYPFFFLAVLVLPGGRLKSSWLKLILDSLLVLGAGTALSSYFLLVPLYLQSRLSLLGKLIILGYPLGDLAILFGLTVTFLYRQNQIARASQMALVVAFLCLFIADSWVAWQILYHISFQAGSPPDLFWIAFYLALPLAGLVWLRCSLSPAGASGAREAGARLEAHPRKRDLEQALRFLSPFAVALLASAVIGLWAIIAPIQPMHPLVPVLMIFGLLLVVLARQGVAVFEHAQVQREREEARGREQAAQASERALREANRQLETFLGMASHELKTPLTTLQLSLQWMQRRAERQEASVEDVAVSTRGELSRSLQQLERLNRLVNDLLDTSRIQAGRLELALKAVDLVAIVRASVEEQRQAFPERTIHLHLPEGPVPLLADADRIGQVVTNYLTNALKYSQEDRPVEVGVELEGQQGRVWVRDQGPGIPLAEQEHLWERFHRVPGIEVQSGSGIGLGLGLHISKTIIEHHQGQVGVLSRTGQGATFWFTVPLAPPGKGSAS
jgi:signal transduction histidine kinase